MLRCKCEHSPPSCILKSGRSPPGGYLPRRGGTKNAIKAARNFSRPLSRLDRTGTTFSLRNDFVFCARVANLKLVLFGSLGVVSYSPSIVSVAVSVADCEMFSVKEWRDLENQVRGRSRSLTMAPFDRPYATFYWSAIVNIALSCTIFELFDVE